MQKPVIGITMNISVDPRCIDTPNAYLRYGLGREYERVVFEFGGIPVMLPYHPEFQSDTLDQLDGIVFSGGDDLDPRYYQAKPHPTTEINDERDRAEWPLLKEALDRDMPVLGICRGMQLLGVMLGGSLIQDIPSEYKTLKGREPKDHAPKALICNRQGTAHDVDIVPGTRLHKILGKSRIRTNSRHHQAVLAVGEGALINASAEDGIIEGLEAPGYSFCLGVQWHPEDISSPTDAALWQAFIRASQD